MNIKMFAEHLLVPIKLSKREEDCLYYLLQGKTAKETARFLNLSHRTVEAYIDNIRKKTFTRNKVELVSKLQSRLINDNST